MGDHILLVTGSRQWGDLDAVCATLAGVAVAHPGDRLVLMHGQCDPREPGTVPPGRIPWHRAMREPEDAQATLLGADWLADWTARAAACWTVERFPADWDRAGKRAGMIRNGEMVKNAAARIAAGASGECLAFVAPCIDPRCAEAEPHGSHGAVGCAQLAAKAGVRGRMLKPSVHAPQSRLPLVT